MAAHGGDGFQKRIELDTTDRKILLLLRDEGRRPTAEIARTIGVSEPTVRKRLDRMLHNGVLKILAVLNAAATGFPVDAIIGISVKTGFMRKVGKQLAAIDQVAYVGYVTGRYEVIIEVLLRDNEELFEFLSAGLEHIEGIASSETFNVLGTEKFSYMWLPTDAGEADRVGIQGALGQSSGATAPKRPARQTRPR